jgi:hypothetical protein
VCLSSCRRSGAAEAINLVARCSGRLRSPSAESARQPDKLVVRLYFFAEYVILISFLRYCPDVPLIVEEELLEWHATSEGAVHRTNRAHFRLAQ